MANKTELMPYKSAFNIFIFNNCISKYKGNEHNVYVQHFNK